MLYATLAVWSSEQEASRVPDGSHFTALTPFCGGREEGERETGEEEGGRGGERKRGKESESEKEMENKRG